MRQFALPLIRPFSYFSGVWEWHSNNLALFTLIIRLNRPISCQCGKQICPLASPPTHIGGWCSLHATSATKKHFGGRSHNLILGNAVSIRFKFDKKQKEEAVKNIISPKWSIYRLAWRQLWKYVNPRLRLGFQVQKKILCVRWVLILKAITDVV